MGFNTAVFFCNDDITDIDKDPVAWWNSIKANLYPPPKDQNFSRHAIVFHSEHADDVGIYAIGGNTTSLLAKLHLGRSASFEEDHIKILHELAERLGYNLTKKSNPDIAMIIWDYSQKIGLAKMAGDIRKWSNAVVELIEYPDYKKNSKDRIDECLASAKQKGITFAIIPTHANYRHFEDDVSNGFIIVNTENGKTIDLKNGKLNIFNIPFVIRDLIKNNRAAKKAAATRAAKKEKANP